MRPYVEVTLTASTLTSMTHKQLDALRELLGEGKWENVEGPLRIDGGDYLGVYLPGLFVGIERDGYTHT